MFSISFLPGFNRKLFFAKGTIVLGSDIEYFIASFDHWRPEDYIKQWQEAVSLIVNGADKSALITEMPTPSEAIFIRWWPMWRFGEYVRLNEQLLFIADLDTPFDVKNPYASIGEYETVDEDGQRISEWIVPLQDFANFLQPDLKIS